MDWLILAGWILAGFVALTVVVMVVGRFLPENYDARIEITFQKSPEAVWAVLSDYRKHPVAGSMSKKVEEQPSKNGLPAWVEDLGSSQIAVTTLSSEPPARLVREFADRVVPMTARSEVRIERLNSGCKVTAVQDTSIRLGTWHVPIFRVIMSVGEAHRAGLKKYWKGIAKELGESAQIVK